mgnify:FL=1
MKRLSVKQRVLIWSAVVLVVMAVLVFLLLQGSIRKQADDYVQTTLRRGAEAAMEEIELEHGVLELDDDLDDIDYAKVTIMDASGRITLYGRVPDFDAPLEADAMRRVEGDGGSIWYVYDVFYTLSPQVQVWVRTSMNLDSITSMEDYSTNIFLWMVVPLILVGVLGGYVVTRRAFRPIGRMAETATNIVDGSDLSRRLDIQGNDEFAKLSRAFDGMLERLERAFEQEKRFTSDVSHELRTPLTVIRTQCELALQESDPQEQRRSLLSIQAQAEKLSYMVKELLTLSRMDANTQPIQMEQVDLGATLELVAESLATAARAKGITLHPKAEPGCVLEADEMLMMRMLINLTSNAIQFGRPGGNVWMELRHREEWLDCKIRDDGIGMTQAQLPHIWERFWQADPARAGEDGSSGLGLSMVAWIIQTHHGQVRVQSEWGGGTEFWIQLPIHQTAQGEA